MGLCYASGHTGIALGFCQHHIRDQLLNPKESKKALMARSGIGVLLYLPIVFGTVLLPIPELGITDSVLNEGYPDRGGGLWETEKEN
jgi:hypothetical protein